MKNVIVLNHPLLQHKLGYLRDERTSSYEFRELMKEISRILAYECMRDWPHMKEVSIRTPIAKSKVKRMDQAPVVVSILRAGLGMLDPVLSMMPFASTGFIGIYRDKFVESTVEYYFKMPRDIKGRTAILCDPLVATADTMIAAIERLWSYEVRDIQILSILMSEKAMRRILQDFPNVKIYALSIEKKVNNQGYLVPGLGDAGDRLYQTK